MTWNDLDMKSRSDLMKLYLKHGITSLDAMKKHYNSFANGGQIEGPDDPPKKGNVGELVDALYRATKREEFMGEPSHKYQFIKPEYVGLSEEELDSLVGQADERGHRLDVVKTEAHPSHYSRGTWSGNDFELTDKGLENVNYTLFGLNDGGQDPQAILTYKGARVLPEITITPEESYIENPYDNFRLHFAKGGRMNINEPYDPESEQKPLSFISGNKLAKKGITYEERARGSEEGMLSAWEKGLPFSSADTSNEEEKNKLLKKAGPMQNSFLLTGEDKDRYMLEHGYIKGHAMDYGLVKKAVGNRNIPVYQTSQDDIDREYLVPIANPFINLDANWFGQDRAELQHAGNYPSTLYIDGRDPSNMYQKAWDLNDYSSIILNKLGYPAVQTTGYSYVPFTKNSYKTMYGTLGPRSYFDEFMKSRNLHREVIDGVSYYFHPEVEITAEKK